MRKSGPFPAFSPISLHAHDQCMHAARVGAGDAEMEAPHREFLAGFGQVPDRIGDQPADGVVFIVGKNPRRSVR